MAKLVNNWLRFPDFRRGLGSGVTPALPKGQLGDNAQCHHPMGSARRGSEPATTKG